MNRKYKVIALVVWTFILLLAILAPSDMISKEVGFFSFIPFFDKFVHFCLFFGFGFLLFWAIFKGRIRKTLIQTFFISIIFGLFTESMQLLLFKFVNRLFEWVDLSFNVLGIVVALFLWYLIIAYKRNKAVKI